MEFLTKDNMNVIRHRPYSLTRTPDTLLCFPDCRYRHFDTTEVIQAESQAVLNIFTEDCFQEAFKK
jgi:hypothetical protein